jgi:hypothetical protein
VALALQFGFAMKKLSSLLLGIGILGTSSLALADRGYQPRDLQRGNRIAIRERVGFDRNDRYDRNDRFDRNDRDGRFDRDVYRPSTTWQALTSIEQLGRYNDSFDARGRFAQLRLQNQTGRTYVRSIEVQFVDGSRQQMRVNQTLDGNHAMVNLTLDSSRRIDRILVDGYTQSGGIQLYAM